MEENRQAGLNPASNEDTAITNPEITEMSEDDLEQVSGGSKNTIKSVTQDVTANKTKTADKIAKQMGDYIKG